VRREAHPFGVERARRHQTLLARLALLLLALIAELVGRSLTHRLNFGRHVSSSYAAAEYYPFLLAAVKVAVALMFARLAWRVVTARRLLNAYRRHASSSAPRMRLELSWRLWLGAFVCTSAIYLVQTDAERLSVGRWPLLAPWLHTSALPVFAVLSVVVAVVYSTVARWLGDYETYAAETAARASEAGAAPPEVSFPVLHDDLPPRGLFGLAFEVRPPPLAA
jgi:hypothetical protein